MDNNLQNGMLENTTVVDKITEPNGYEQLMNKNRKDILKQVSFGLMILAGILILGGFGYLFYLNTNSVKVYQQAITSVVDDVFEGLYQSVDKTNTTVKLSAYVNLTEGLIDQEIIDYINKTSILFNTQFDKTKQQMVVKLDSVHDNESLINLAMFVNAKDEKTYLYAKDYYDKYLEIPVDDYSEIKELFEELELTKSQKASAKKAKNIIKKEITKLITKDNCYKKDGAFVFEITDRQFESKLEMLFNNLKNNEEFLDCFEDSETVKLYLELMTEDYEDNYEGNLPAVDILEQKIIITMTKGIFSTTFDKLTIDVSGSKIVIENKDKNISYEMLVNNKKVMDGYFKTRKVKNTEKLEISLSIPEFGSATLYIDTTTLKNQKIEAIDSSKAVKLEELSEDEKTEIMTKIEESPLYELISSYIPENDYEDDDYWDDEESKCTGTLEYDGVSVKLNLPSKAEANYCDTDYARYDIDDISVDYDLWDYDSYNEYFEDVKSDLKYQDGDSTYQNKVLSSVKTKNIKGRTYYYVDYTFDYVSYDTTKVYRKYICTKIENDVYLTLEIGSWYGPIDDNLVDSVLNIE